MIIRIRSVSATGALMLIALTPIVMNCGSDSTVLPSEQVCDEQNFTITNPQSGHVYTWGGTGMWGAGEVGQAPGATRLYWPVDICFDPAGSPIVLDWNNHRVLALDANGKFKKLIGYTFGQPEDGPADQANLNHPTHVTFTPDGTKLVLSAWHNSIVMEMDMATNWIARYCGTGGRCFNGDGLARLASCLDLPVCAAFSPLDGKLYISDQAHHVIRRIDSDGSVHICVGTAPAPHSVPNCDTNFGYSGDGGPATSARLKFECSQSANPSGRICFDAVGNLYIADTKNNAIRVVHASDQTIDTVAGLGPAEPGYSGDGDLATLARLFEPRDVAVGADGTIYITDTGNHVIRAVDPNGVISTIAGVVRGPFADPPQLGDLPVTKTCQLRAEHGALASEVHFNDPIGIELDPAGNLWIADRGNNLIRILYR
jgi:DNA-binding beta-propeller fold protein YncE